MGVDVAERAVSLGRDECGLNLRRVRLVDLWEEKERFDVVTLFELLEHLQDPLDILLQARRLVREGGTILCTVRIGIARKFRAQLGQIGCRRYTCSFSRLLHY